MTDLIKANLFTGSNAQIQDSVAYIRTTVIHADLNTLTVILTNHLKHRSKRQRLMGACIIVLIKGFTASGQLSMKAGTIITSQPSILVPISAFSPEA